jgi:hypothetical protein
MTGEELRALVAEFAAYGEEARPGALEDAIREATGWVAYLYLYRAAVTVHSAQKSWNGRGQRGWIVTLPGCCRGERSTIAAVPVPISTV